MTPYDVDTIVSEIKDGGYSRIAIQSADVVSATSLCNELSRRFRLDGQDKELYVLGDVFIGSCCTDIVAAKRCMADYVIHLGPSCQSSLAPPMPVRMIFNKEPVEDSLLVSNIRKAIDERVFTRVLLIYDSSFHHLIDLFSSALADVEKDKFIAQCRDKVPVESDPSVDDELFCGRAVFSLLGAKEKCPATVDKLFQGDINTLVLYIENRSQDNSTLDRIAISCSGSQIQVISILDGHVSSRNEDTLGDKLRLKRYRNVEKVRDASAIGVLVISRNIRDASKLRSSLCRLIESCGKRCYTFSVNCLTEAKLANFPNIDIYCLLSCGESILSLPDELSRSTVAPFELLVALDRIDWSLPYEFEFSRMLQYTTVESTDMGPGSSKELRKLQGNCELKLQIESFMSSLTDNSKRTFGGVDPHHGLSDTPTIIKGFHGTASGYDHEKRL